MSSDVSKIAWPTVMGMSDARRRILDSYAQILRESGAPATTLEAVAEHAEVSKGGLLYHFGSKAKLAEGLIDLLRELVTTDLELMAADPAGPVDYLLRTSDGSNSAFSLIYEAAFTLALAGNDTARDYLPEAHLAWERGLEEAGVDPITARVVMLLSDGLSMRASIGQTFSAADHEAGAPSLEGRGNMDDIMELVRTRLLDEPHDPTA